MAEKEGAADDDLLLDMLDGCRSRLRQPGGRLGRWEEVSMKSRHEVDNKAELQLIDVGWRSTHKAVASEQPLPDWVLSVTGPGCCRCCSRAPVRSEGKSEAPKEDVEGCGKNRKVMEVEVHSGRYPSSI